MSGKHSMVCRLCKSRELSLYYTQGNSDEFRFYRCRSCGLVNYDLCTGLNQTKYAGSYADPFDESLRTNIAQSRTFKFIQSHLRTGGKVFDIGCGNGKLLSLLKNEGWEVKGLELSPLLAECVQKTLQIEVEVADFTMDGAADPDTCDVVILRHVLEHLPDPLHAMNRINSFIKPGGHAVLEFPNIDAMDLRMKRFFKRMNLHRKRYDDNYRPGHCNEYCRTSFNHLARKTGFEVLVWETYSLKPVSNFFCNRFPVGNKARTILRKNNL